MTRIVVIGADCTDLAAELARLGLSSVDSVTAFRELVYTQSGRPIVMEKCRGPAPHFGSDRPYLKRKKGRS